MSILGKRIAERLRALGHPAESGGQTWLAKKTGMSQPGVKAILSGGVKRPRMLREIAAALHTSHEYLLGETDDPSPRMPKELIEAIEKLPGAPLTDEEVDILLGQIRLIAKSRTPQNDSNQNNESPPTD